MWDPIENTQQLYLCWDVITFPFCLCCEKDMMKGLLINSKRVACAVGWECNVFWTGKFSNFSCPFVYNFEIPTENSCTNKGKLGVS
jgi:hypothetical protein